MLALYLIPSTGFGGAERQALMHIVNLPRTGIEVVAAVGPGETLRRELARAGVAIHDLGSSDLWESVRSLTAFARRESVEILFAGRRSGWLAGSHVGRALGIPVVWRAGCAAEDRSNPSALSPLMPLLAPDLLVASSESDRRLYAEALCVPTAVLPNGVDLTRFNPESARPRVRRVLELDGAAVVGVVAPLSLKPGLTFAARALRIVAARVPAVRLLIAGELPWKEHFEQLFSVMGLGERVTFLGHVDDIESFYSSCDVVALTCERRAPELFSNVMLEAMGTGCAVVATAGGTSELVVSGVNGYIESSRDPERFADRVITLLEREELRRALGRAARQSIVTRHAEPRVTEALADLLLRTRRSRD